MDHRLAFQQRRGFNDLFDRGKDTGRRLLKVIANAIAFGQTAAEDTDCRQAMQRAGAGLAGLFDPADGLLGITQAAVVAQLPAVIKKLLLRREKLRTAYRSWDCATRRG